MYQPEYFPFSTGVSEYRDREILDWYGIEGASLPSQQVPIDALLFVEPNAGRKYQLKSSHDFACVGGGLVGV